MIQPLTIGVLGSGPTGQTLAKVFLEHGHPVMIGSRDPAKLLDWLSDAGAQAHFGTFTETPSLASWAFWSASEDSTAQIGVVWIGEVLSVGHGASECRKCVSLDPYIECVFENDLVELDAAATTTKSQQRCGNNSSCATRLMCFPTPPRSAAALTWITPSPTATPTTADRPAKPESATSDPTPAATTDKTHGGWQVRQPEPGTWLWRTPQRRIYLVNATGTHPLGNTEFAQTIWRAASPPQQLAS